MADKVEIISTCSVKKASSITNDNDQSYGISRVDLTPWDLQLLFFDPIQKGVFFYKPESSARKQEFEKTFIDHLKHSLSQALDYFPPLAGRLAMTTTNSTTHMFVDCNNKGASFTHAVARGVYIRDILQPVYIPSTVGSLFPPEMPLNCQGMWNPLLRVQVTELVDGYFIGCTMNHCVVDGTAFWHFFNSWSEISRGIKKILKLPIFDRPDILHEVIPVPLPPLDLNSYDNFSTPPLLERVFHFSKENVSKLKARANFEMATDNVSTLQALVAHIWRAVMRARGLDPNTEVRCMMLVGARARLLPDTYFGNAVHFINVTTTYGNLIHNGLGWSAMELNKVVSLQTREEVMRVYEDYGKNFKIYRKGGLMTRDSNISISSSPRFNVYGVDFGWGRPVAVRSGKGQKYDGKITVFPAMEAGGIDVEACLSPECLVAVGDDAEFMEAVTF